MARLSSVIAEYLTNYLVVVVGVFKTFSLFNSRVDIGNRSKSSRIQKSRCFSSVEIVPGFVSNVIEIKLINYD